MENANPYASPQAAPAALASVPDGTLPLHGVRRWRQFVIVPHEAALPDLCIRCGMPANGPLRHCGVAWIPPWVQWLAWMLIMGILAFVFTSVSMAFFAILFATLVFIPFQRLFGRSTSVCFRMCERHERRRDAYLWLAITCCILAAGTTVVGLGLRFATGVFNYGAMAVFVMTVSVLVGVAICAAARRSPELSANRIADGLVWLHGIDRRFLEQIPEISDAEADRLAMVKP